MQGTGSMASPIIIPAQLPWTSISLNFANGFTGVTYDVTSQMVLSFDKAYQFKWAAPGDGVVTFSTCGTTEDTGEKG